MQKSTTNTVQYITVEAEYAEQRIDNFLITKLKGLPKTRVYRILRKGEVRVNKKRVQPSYRLQVGDHIRIPPMYLETKIPLAPSQYIVATLAERILFEDKNFLIINKPTGIPVHGGSQVKSGVVETLRTIYPKLPQLELAHRLDSDTSGCLILAKKRSILREMHDLFRSGTVHKIYWALTKGEWQESELIVDVPLQKNLLVGGERIVKMHKEGKQSLTVFKPLQSFTTATLVEATLHTGRTHQIRVHAQYRGHPIAGDEKYGDREFNKEMRGYGLRRLFLHAYQVEFTLPSTGQHVSVTAPLEPELTACLKNMKSDLTAP